MRRMLFTSCAIALLALGSLSPLSRYLAPRAQAAGAAPAPVTVLTQHNDNSRTGANLNETLLTTANVNVNQFGLVFTRTVDGQIYAQPLYVPNLNIAGQDGQGTRNVVFVATMHNSVYAFDADDPAAAAPLWQVNLGPSAPLPDPTDPTFGNRYGPYHDIRVEIGIVSTPVIDLASNTLYVVAFTKESDGYHHRLHALDLTTGQEKDGGPTEIAASVAGTGDGAISGTLTMSNRQQLQRSALLLSNGIVYITFASHADTDPYHGWVLGYDARTLSLVSVFNDTPNGGEAGIWQDGQGPAADADGNIYLSTGNGTWDAGSGGVDYGDSVLKLSPSITVTDGITVTDWFTPYNQDVLAATDKDLGSGGPLLIPRTTLLLTGGKQGVFYLLDRANLGHFHSGDDSQIVQSVPLGHGIFSSPVYWAGPNGPTVYVWGVKDDLKAFTFTNGLLGTTPAFTYTAVAAPFPGAMLSLSANGSAPNSGIIWASQAISNANQSTQPGVLRAFDASDVSHELWDSTQDPARDGVGLFAKFNAPTVANGKVYLGTFSGYLAVYGLLPQALNSPTGTATATDTPSATDTPPVSATATATQTPLLPNPTATATLTATATTPPASATATATATTPTGTPTPTTPSATSTSTATSSPTHSPTATLTATDRPSATATSSPTNTFTPSRTTTATQAPLLPSPSATTSLTQFAAVPRAPTPTATSTPAGGVPAATATATATTDAPTPARTRAPARKPVQTLMAVPAPWSSRDIGAVARAGKAGYIHAAFTLWGSGHDIWSTADAFRFVYQPLRGDGEITARVTRVDATNAWAKAGVMIRATLAANSAQGMAIVTSRKGSSFQYRAQATHGTLFTAGPHARSPYWVRLVRRGTRVTGYVSADGVRWKRLGSVSIKARGTVYAGLVVTAHNAKALCAATFDHVALHTTHKR